MPDLVPVLVDLGQVIMDYRGDLRRKIEGVTRSPRLLAR